MLDLRVNITDDCRRRVSVDHDSFLNGDNIVKNSNSFTQISKQCKDLLRRIHSVKKISHLSGQQLTAYLVSWQPIHRKLSAGMAARSSNRNWHKW